MEFHPFDNGLKQRYEHASILNKSSMCLTQPWLFDLPVVSAPLHGNTTICPGNALFHVVPQESMCLSHSRVFDLPVVSGPLHGNTTICPGNASFHVVPQESMCLSQFRVFG